MICNLICSFCLHSHLPKLIILTNGHLTSVSSLEIFFLKSSLYSWQFIFLLLLRFKTLTIRFFSHQNKRLFRFLLAGAKVCLVWIIRYCRLCYCLERRPFNWYSATQNYEVFLISTCSIQFVPVASRLWWRWLLRTRYNQMKPFWPKAIEHWCYIWKKLWCISLRTMQYAVIQLLISQTSFHNPITLLF